MDLSKFIKDILASQVHQDIYDLSMYGQNNTNQIVKTSEFNTGHQNGIHTP